MSSGNGFAVMNTQIKRLGIGLVVCYLAIFAKMHQTQLVEVQAIAEQPTNKIQAEKKANQPRGKIISGDGLVVAESLNVGGPNTPRKRQYPEGDLFAHVAGIATRLGTKTGVERSYDEYLTGQSLVQQFDGLTNLFSARENVGHVTLTVRKDLQELAREQLAGRAGSVVAVDPRDGRLLAFYSAPSFDPNSVVGGPTQAEITAATAAFDELAKAPGQPLLAHQYQDTYFPGSTFKIVVAGAGLERGGVTGSTRIPEVLPGPGDNGVAKFYASRADKGIPNYNNGPPCGGTIGDMLKVSCNTGFAMMGADMGGPAMLGGAEAFGFNQDVQIDLPRAAKSVLPPEQVKERGFRAQLALGQNEAQATPLQMALVAAAVANGGTIMKPHVLDNVRNLDAEVVHTFKPEPWLTALNPTNAQVLREAMYRTANEAGGTGAAARVPGAEVAGKTGTAEAGPGIVHTWFVGYAGPPGQPPSVAVSVVVLNQRGNFSTGGQISAPIAQRMLAKALEVGSLPAADPSGVIATTTTTTPAPVLPPTTVTR